MSDCKECGGKTVKISPIGSKFDSMVCEKCGAVEKLCQHLNITSMQQHDGNVMHVCTDCDSTLTAKLARAERVTRDSASQTLGESICKALNINARMVTSLTLTIDAGSIPVLGITLAILGDDSSALRSVLEMYQLTPIASAPHAAGQSPTESN